MIWKDETHTKATFTFQINLMPTFLPYVFRLKRLYLKGSNPKLVYFFVNISFDYSLNGI
jgi:hypothetical protein